MSAAQQPPMELNSRCPFPWRIISRTSARGAREWANPLMVRWAPSGIRAAASARLTTLDFPAAAVTVASSVPSLDGHRLLEQRHRLRPQLLRILPVELLQRLLEGTLVGDRHDDGPSRPHLLQGFLVEFPDQPQLIGGRLLA